MREISSTVILGFIPLDIILHITAGIVLTLLLRKRFRPLSIVAIILSIQVIKELIDSNSMTFTYQEAVADTLFTLLYPLLISTISLIKKYNN